MHISSLFFIVIITVVCLFGGIMAAGTFQRMDDVSKDLVNQSDSLGNMPSAYTNTTYSLIGNVTAAESDGTSLFVVFITVIIFICIIIGGMVMLRRSGLGGNKYRT